MHIFFSILWKIVRNETSTIIPARVSNEKASTTPHIYRWTPCTPQTCVSHKTALQHSASSTIRQHYHTDTWLPQWPAIQTRSAREREREKSAREPLQATSITSGVTGWRKPVREAKPRHSKHETASDKKPCPPNGVREKKRRPSRKCLHLYMLLSEAFNENAIAKGRRLQVETHYNWAMCLTATKVCNATMLWKHTDQSLICCCFATASHRRTSHRRRLRTQHLECGLTGLH